MTIHTARVKCWPPEAKASFCHWDTYEVAIAYTKRMSDIPCVLDNNRKSRKRTL